MFTEAKDYQIHPNQIETRIQDEKRRWIRENWTRSSPASRIP